MTAQKGIYCILVCECIYTSESEISFIKIQKYAFTDLGSWQFGKFHWEKTRLLNLRKLTNWVVPLLTCGEGNKWCGQLSITFCTVLTTPTNWFIVQWHQMVLVTIITFAVRLALICKPSDQAWLNNIHNIYNEAIIGVCTDTYVIYQSVLEKKRHISFKWLLWPQFLTKQGTILGLRISSFQKCIICENPWWFTYESRNLWFTLIKLQF